jgi:hypothetical protein
MLREDVIRKDKCCGSGDFGLLLRPRRREFLVEQWAAWWVVREIEIRPLPLNAMAIGMRFDAGIVSGLTQGFMVKMSSAFVCAVEGVQDCLKISIMNPVTWLLDG